MLIDITTLNTLPDRELASGISGQWLSQTASSAQADVLGWSQPHLYVPQQRALPLPLRPAEIIKYGLIRDAQLFEWLEQNMDRLLARDPEVRGQGQGRERGWGGRREGAVGAEHVLA